MIKIINLLPSICRPWTPIQNWLLVLNTKKKKYMCLFYFYAIHCYVKLFTLNLFYYWWRTFHSLDYDEHLNEQRRGGLLGLKISFFTSPVQTCEYFSPSFLWLRKYQKPIFWWKNKNKNKNKINRWPVMLLITFAGVCLFFFFFFFFFSSS